MSMNANLELYEALTSINIDPAKAKAVAGAFDAAIERQYSANAQQLATRGDIAEVRKDTAEMETRLLRAMQEMQRWTLTAIFSAVAVLAAIKFFT